MFHALRDMVRAVLSSSTKLSQTSTAFPRGFERKSRSLVSSARAARCKKEKQP
jgi:hypothetical protein